MKTMYNLYNVTLSHTFYIGIIETDLLLNYKQNNTWEIEEMPQYILDKHDLELFQLNNKRKYKFIRKIGKAKALNKVMLYVERKAL